MIFMNLWLKFLSSCEQNVMLVITLEGSLFVFVVKTTTNGEVSICFSTRYGLESTY